jgi:hypothetical protein
VCSRAVTAAAGSFWGWRRHQHMLLVLLPGVCPRTTLGTLSLPHATPNIQASLNLAPPPHADTNIHYFRYDQLSRLYPENEDYPLSLAHSLHKVGVVDSFEFGDERPQNGFPGTVKAENTAVCDLGLLTPAYVVGLAEASTSAAHSAASLDPRQVGVPATRRQVFRADPTAGGTIRGGVKGGCARGVVGIAEARTRCRHPAGGYCL